MVRVQECYPLTLRDPCPAISSCRRPGVRLADECDGEAVRYRGRIILRSVIDDDDFQRRHSLRECAFNSPGNGGRAVIYRNYDADSGVAHRGTIITCRYIFRI